MYAKTGYTVNKPRKLPATYLHKLTVFVEQTPNLENSSVKPNIIFLGGQVSQDDVDYRFLHNGKPTLLVQCLY